MATLQIKHFPDDLHAKLAARAKEERTTMSEYATRALQRELSLPSRATWLAEVERTRPALATGGRPFDVTALMEEIRGAHDDEERPVGR